MEKRLYKSSKDKMLFGVCGGIAEYFEVDPTLVRLGTAVLIFTSIGIPAYIVAAIVMPEGNNPTPSKPKTQPEEVVVEAEDIKEESDI